MAGPNPITDAALERATGIVRSYIRIGDQYTEDEITTLANSHDPLMIMTVVDLAIEFLFLRRGSKLSAATEQRVKQAYSFCEGLRDGKMLFGTVARNAVAGTPLVAAVGLSNLAWYAQASNSAFFPPRRGTTYPA